MMIIDGKLVVSKKKKVDLIAELKQKGFKAITKHVDASQIIEEAAPEAEIEEEADEVVQGANSYDYLLGVSRALSLMRCLLTDR